MANSVEMEVSFSHYLSFVLHRTFTVSYSLYLSCSTLQYLRRVSMQLADQYQEYIHTAQSRHR